MYIFQHSTYSYQFKLTRNTCVCVCFKHCINDCVIEFRPKLSFVFQINSIDETHHNK